MGGLRIPGPLGDWINMFKDHLPKTTHFMPLRGLGFYFSHQVNDPASRTRVVDGLVQKEGDRVRIGVFDVPVADLGPRDGAPLDKPLSKRNENNVRVRNGALVVNHRKGTVVGSFVANLPDANPDFSTDVEVQFQSRPKDSPEVHVRATAFGLAHLDMKLSLRSDAKAFRQALDSAFRLQSDPFKTLEKLGEEGLDAAGAVDFSWVRGVPLLNRVLRTKFKISMPEIAKSAKPPLMGSPTSRSIDYRLYGIVPIPAGGITQTAALGWGTSLGSWGRTSGYSLATTLTPLVNPITQTINTYVYLDIQKVVRVRGGMDVGFRVTVSPELGDLSAIRKVLEGNWTRHSPELRDAVYFHRSEIPPPVGEARRGPKEDLGKPFLMGSVLMSF